jgi:hypothetical protein
MDLTFLDQQQPHRRVVVKNNHRLGRRRLRPSDVGETTGKRVGSDLAGAITTESTNFNCI